MENDYAFWEDGEWVSWAEVNSHLWKLEMQALYPGVDVELIPVFESLRGTAIDYYELTGRHLQVYGDLGELFGAIQFGIKLHRNYAQGSDGRLGDDFVEIKTITPFKSNDTVELNLDRNFSKVLIVKISEDFEFEGKMFDRKSLKRSAHGKLRLRWSDFSAEQRS